MLVLTPNALWSLDGHPLAAAVVRDQCVDALVHVQLTRCVHAAQRLHLAGEYSK